MAGEQRKCANCRYFRDAGMAKNGWCTHPKRQHTTDVKILVRAGELACRNSWGGDLFQSNTYDKQSARPGIADDLPGSYQEPAASRDDEVTSVITPPDRQHIPHVEEDRVVSDRPAPLQDDDDDPYNDAARHDQDERARIIARGNRDALLRARERHSHRHKRSSGGPGSDDEGDEPVIRSAPNDRITTRQMRFTDRSHSQQPSQPAFVRNDPVPRSEVEHRWQAPVDRFDSVPEVDPSFELPGWRGQNKAASRPVAGDAPQVVVDQPETTGVTIAPVSSYEHVLQRARRVREGKLHKPARPIRPARAQAHHATSRSTVESDHRNGVETSERMPDLPLRLEANSEDSEVSSDSDRWTTGEFEDAPQVAGVYGAGDKPANDSDMEPEHGDLEYVEEDDWDLHGPADDSMEAEAEPHYPHDRFSERSHRRGGWLSRFGLGRRQSTESYDDATITRHSSAIEGHDTWDEGDVGYDPNETSNYEEARHPNEHQVLRLDDDYGQGHWSDDVQHDAEGDYAQPSRVGVQYDSNADVEYDNTLGPEAPLSYLEETYEATDVGIGAQSPYLPPRRTDSWHRQRQVPSLPDLDDNLFAETFERRRAPSPTATLDRAPAIEGPLRQPVRSSRTASDAPSESYFRAARFRDWEESHSSDSMQRIDENHQPEAVGAAVLPDLEEPRLDLRDIVARGTELLDMTIDIAPEVPRECRTCRSFRSADGGARGWCTNDWAFTHRRMVNEEDLACETTVGCWWLPADRYWLIENQSGYASPTPRMDELIARHNGLQERKSSGTGA